MNKIKELDIKVKIMIGVVIALIVIVIGTLVFYFNGISAVSSKDTEVVVEIPQGSSGSKIIEILDEKDLLNSKMAANIFLKLHSFEFKSNTYILNKNMNLETILTIIEKADDKYISNTKITVLDGLTIPEYAKAISENTSLKYEDILAKWEDQTYLKELIKDYWFLSDDILANEIYFPLEGYLAPETYIITKSEENIDSITRLMLDQTKKELDEYKDKIVDFKINNKSCTIHEFITLASIVQRESPANDEDRQMITGVFLNRLAKPMRLQSDVTTNYANQEVKVAVTYKDLATDSKYNTYKYDGLPIGPISSISPDVLKDVVTYKTSDYYFFFSTKDAKVLYAKTFEEHKAIVAANKWY